MKAKREEGPGDELSIRTLRHSGILPNEFFSAGDYRPINSTVLWRPSEIMTFGLNGHTDRTQIHNKKAPMAHTDIFAVPHFPKSHLSFCMCGLSAPRPRGGLKKA